MVDVVDTSPTGQQVAQLLEASLSQTPDGVELSYRVLEHFAALHKVATAWMVLEPAVLGPQLFLRGRQPATPAMVGEFLSRPPGIYTSPDVSDHTISGALAGTCNLVLSAQAAELTATVDPPSGLAGRGVAEAALARAAAARARGTDGHTPSSCWPRPTRSEPTAGRRSALRCAGRCAAATRLASSAPDRCWPCWATWRPTWPGRSWAGCGQLWSCPMQPTSSSPSPPCVPPTRASTPGSSGGSWPSGWTPPEGDGTGARAPAPRALRPARARAPGAFRCGLGGAHGGPYTGHRHRPPAHRCRRRAP